MGLADDAVQGAGMGSVLGPLGAVAGSVVGAGASLIGDVMQEGSSAANVANQENYATQMADTQYQRGVKDMEAAGLNPLAMYSSSGGNPAPSPTGSVAMPGQFSNVGQGAAQGVSSVQSAMQENADLQTQQENLRLIHSQRTMNDANAMLSLARMGNMSSAGSSLSQMVDAEQKSASITAQQDLDLLKAQTSMGSPYWLAKAVSGTPIPGAVGSAVSAGMAGGAAAASGGTAADVLGVAQGAL